MSTLEFVLVIATAVALFIPVFRRQFKSLPRWLDFIPAALVVLMVVLIAAQGFHMYMLVAYIMVMVLFLQTIKSMIRPSAPVKTTRVRFVVSLLGPVVGIAGLLCGILFGPLIVSGAGEDLSRESWTTAFDHLNGILTQRYGFTAWKQIDWQALHARYAPRIAAAEAAGDQDAYHLALREYLFSIPDGHIKFSGEDLSLWQAAIAGGYGLAVIELDDGSVIAHVLSEGGPAQVAGMTWGAEILEWDGEPAGVAIGKVSPIWMGLPAATRQGLRFAQQNLLTRARVGTQVSLAYRNFGEAAAQKVTLTAIDDGMQPLYASLGAIASAMLRQDMGEEGADRLFMQPPAWEILPGGYGYLHVYHVVPAKDDPDFVEIVEQALTEFVAQDVPGVILDVRGNPGGNDTLVPEMMGYFLSEPGFYEYMVVENWLMGLRFFDLSIPLRLEPKEPHYSGPLAVLIDQHTKSSGEGFPLVAQQLPQGHVVGIYGTNGSFGMCCASVSLPAGFELLYPLGQSQDADHQVQLDSDFSLQGGVLPDIRLPLTRDTVYAMFVEGEDLVLQYAIQALQEP